MTKLVFITQQVDPRHPALAATVPKIRALAKRVGMERTHLYRKLRSLGVEFRGTLDE